MKQIIMLRASPRHFQTDWVVKDFWIDVSKHTTAEVCPPTVFLFQIEDLVPKPSTLAARGSGAANDRRHQCDDNKHGRRLNVL
ncbi:hypothetical protein EVAR_14438_1 [Eumeta japonica]|uniref:Uncharacterized protein n=1 Tax=Eumeta variegata TaxID=151549 RepID=A0A4C1TXL4_EUMVA|nr:hypothetical protein EVAR_14438_1 [Eumeta japonica]